MKKIAIFLVLALAVVVLAGCGGEQKISGKYVRVENGSYDANYSYEFLDDGKCNFTTAGVTTECGYELKGKNLTIEMTYGSFKGTVDGNKITVNEFGEEIVYEKQ